MAREIKFRAFDNVDYMSTPFTLQDLQLRKIAFTSGCPVMQFTGLLDKNGKDIYESDIVQSASGRDIYEVIWKHSGWFRKPIKGNWRTTSLFVEYKNQSVIGNIYETPELLNP